MAEISAHELINFSDLELDQYFEKSRHGGIREIKVKDPENLPESFLQRLRDRAKIADAARSHAVDLDLVNARLLEGRERRSPTSPTESFHSRDFERTEYEELVNDGGRPVYPIELADDMAKNPEAYRSMVRPWLEYPDKDEPGWEILQAQLTHWHKFRYWQTCTRRRGRPPRPLPEYNVFSWHFRRKAPSYTEAVKNLFAYYGFSRPFQFHDDPKQQDKLTTWIEYLGFAYAQRYQYALHLEKMKPELNKAFQRIVDKKVLKPHETLEYLLGPDGPKELQREVDEAKAAVRLAEATLKSAQESNDNPRQSRSGKPVAGNPASQSRLDEAKEKLAAIERRHWPIIRFYEGLQTGYYFLTRGAKWNNARLPWILDQLPLIEAEMNESGVAEMNESGVAQMNESDVAQMNESDVAQMNESGVGQMNESVAQMNESSVAQTSPNPIPSARRGESEQNRQGRNTDTPNSPSDHTARSRLKGGIRKRSHGDTAGDESPPKRRSIGDQDLASRNVDLAGSGIESAGAPQGCGHAEDERPDGDKQAARKTGEYSNPKVTKPAKNSERPAKQTQNAPRSSASPPSLRRSARIAAREQMSNSIVESSGAANSSSTRHTIQRLPRTNASTSSRAGRGRRRGKTTN